MTILENLLYLLLLIFIVLLYGYVIKVLISYILQIIKTKSLVPVKSIFLVSLKSPIIKLFLLAFVIFNVSMYITIRDNWINPNTEYHQAKEYFVTNLTVSFYRKALNKLVKIDNLIMQPLNLMNDILYLKGISYLPKNDGEIGYWYYVFNAYYYTRNNYFPNQNLSKIKTPSLEQHKILLNGFYNHLKILATYPIKDKKVELEKYKIFPLLGGTFFNKRFLYYGNYVDYNIRLKSYEDKNFENKISNLLDWTLKFSQEYQSNSNLKNFIENKKPVISVVYSDIIIRITESFLHQNYIQNNFRCDNNMIPIFLEYRANLANNDSSLFKLNKSQQRIMIDLIYNSTLGQSMVHHINKTCNIKTDVVYPTENWIKNNYNMGDNK